MLMLRNNVLFMLNVLVPIVRLVGMSVSWSNTKGSFLLKSVA